MTCPPPRRRAAKRRKRTAPSKTRDVMDTYRKVLKIITPLQKKYGDHAAWSIGAALVELFKPKAPR